MNKQTEGETIQKNKFNLIFSIMVGYSLIYMDKNMIGTAVLPIAKEFNLNPSQTGLIMSCFFLGYSIMLIPGGILADKIGSKKVLMLSLASISLFSFAFGSVSSLFLFMVIRFFSGIGHGGFPPSCSKSISDNFPKERRTFVQALILSTSGIGGILAFTLGANLISMNWRYGYICLGILFAVSIILVALFVPEHPQNMDNTSKRIPLNFKQVAFDRNLQFLFIAMILLNFLLYGIMSWLPSFLSAKFSLDITTIGYLLAGNAIFQTIATMFSGLLLSKVFLGKERIFILISTSLSAAFILLFVLSNSLALSMMSLVIISMLSVSAFTAIFTWPHKIMDSSVIGASIGIINTGGTIGGILAPMILGYLIKIAGGSFTLAFVFMAIASILSGCVVLGISKEGA
jgi:MFS family permease